MNTQNTQFEDDQSLRQVLNVQQAAEFLQMSPRFVSDHAEEFGGIPLGGTKRVGRWRFTREKLIESLNRRGRTRKKSV